MSKPVTSPVPVDKQRIRNQIDNQVQDFLRRGGKINVVDQNSDSSSPLGGVWETLNDEIGLGS